MNPDELGPVAKELQRARWVLRERHRVEWASLEAEERRLRAACPHARLERHPDASGNNGSWDECLDCGADV